MASASIGRLCEFNPQEEAIDAYLLRLKHFFKANNIKEDKKVSVLITVIGPKVLATLSDIVSPSEVDSKTYDELVDILKEHYAPRRLVVAERYVFYSRAQRPGETISDFVIAIKHLAGSCSFGTFLRDALRDKLVSGITNEHIRQKLLSEEKGFEETYALALRLEQAEKQSNIFELPRSEVAKINVRGYVQSNCNGSQKSSPRPNVNVRTNSFQNHKCWRCGSGDHQATSCNYASFKCHRCKKQGHLMKMCKIKTTEFQKKGNNKFKTVHQLEEGVHSDRCIEESVEEINLHNIGSGDEGYKVRLLINSRPVCMELDTGSALSICPDEIFENIFSDVKLKPVNVKLLTYSGHNVRVLGQADVKVSHNNQEVQLPLIVVKLEQKNQPMLLGRNWLQHLKLDWQNIFACKTVEASDKSKLPSLGTVANNSSDTDVDRLKKKYNDVFQPGTGEIKGVKAYITLKSGSVPKFCKFRPVPFALREKVEEELNRWIRDGIAYKVSNAQWATPLVVVPKPNGVRLCADFKITLNPCVETEHYPLPQAQDIFASLAGCSVFSCIDLSNAYLQLPVAEESQHLLTLSTHKGLVRLRRLPFGLSSSPALFQAAIDQILSGIPGTVAYLDDVLIGASSRVEGLRRLEMVLQRLAEYGVKVNGTKCKFLQSSIEYLGHVISADGLCPQERNLSALKDAPEPTNKDELRAYLGLINYYHSFIPNLSARLSCFYDLLRKDVAWNWSKECSQAFQESKSWVLKSSLLVHYDVNKPIVLTCDASPRGVAAVLSHLIDGNERPIAFASKTLSPSERNYSQLHREALALIFGVTKFHKYLYGRKNIILQTDHQPLAVIFGSKKGIPCLAAARLQRWALILSSYNLEVRYRKAADVPHADALSRLPLPNSEAIELEANYISHVDQCIEVLCCSVNEASSITAKDVERYTDRDPILSKVRDFVMHGWREVSDPEMTVFHRKKDELSVDKNCILWGSRVIVPKKLQSAVLDMLHEQHPGITRMKMLARSYVWWPGLDQSIEDTVSACKICQYTRNAEPRIPLQQWPVATYRWQRLHIDYAEEPNTREQLLIVVDSFSKWLEVFVMKSTTSANTIERLRTLFSSYGLPEEVVTDNATCFTSYEFKEFLQKNGVKLTLTPPYHAESNGAAERCVQIVKKNLIRQVLEENLRSYNTVLQHKVDNFLFAYRNTPTTTTGMTPAELFLNWKPRTKLTLLKPNLMETIQEKKNQQKEASDRLRGENRSFVDGQKVLVKTVRNEKVSWVPGKILVQRSPVTYIVSVLGKTRYCHADHLRPDVLPDEEGKEVVQSKSNLPCQQPEKAPLTTSSRKSGRTVRKPFKLNL